jgi:anti-anti-sigma factor
VLDIQCDPAMLIAVFSSDLAIVDTICTVAQQLLEEHCLSSSQFPSQLVLRELLNNAVRHGNHENMDKSVKCVVRVTDDFIFLEVADEGEGFDWHKRFPPLEVNFVNTDENGELFTSSYGMRILATYTSEVIFNDKGNRVCVRIDKHPKGDAVMSTVQKEGQRAVYRPTDNIVASEIDSLRTELKQLLAEGILELVIDLAGVRMIDSIGLGVLISAHNSLKKTGGSLSIINASKELYDLFRSMRLTQHFSVTAV